MPETREQLGEIVASHSLAHDCLLLLGWSAEAMAGDGIAALEDRRQDRGRFRAASWPGPETGRSQRWFVAALRAPTVGAARPGDFIRLHGAGSKTPIIAGLPQAVLDAPAFAVELAARLGSHAGAAAQFLLETFSNRASRALPSVSALLSAVLQIVAEEDGVVEVVGALDGEGLLLQGWSRSPRNIEPRLLLHDDGIDEYAVAYATFARPDLQAPALGFIALVRANEHGKVPEPRQIFLKAGGRFRRLGMVANPVRLGAEQVPNHVRDMLPNLHVEAGIERLFSAAARPRYVGQDTVSTLGQPVRMAIDVAARIPGAGWYVTGWMLDPLALVSAVTLCGSGGLAERLDGRWTRVVREDVSAGFSGDARFSGCIADNKHGFTVFVPHAAGGRDAWLELEIGNGGCAFMPLNLTGADDSEGRQRLLTSFDIHKPSASEIVERHLGPLFHAAGAALKRVSAHHSLRDVGAKRAARLVVPIVDPKLRTKMIVAGLARQQTGEVAMPVFVCCPSTGEMPRSLLRELDFYGLDAEVLVAAEPVDAAQALEIGARTGAASRLLFLSPHVHAISPDWAARLLAALGTGADPAVVSPTLLYEDWSIRYAGIDGVRFLSAMPFADVASERAGYPRGSMAAAAAPTLIAALECCAMTRSAFESVDGFAGGFTLPDLKGPDLFLRMQKAGIRITWVPDVELYALDEPVSPDAYWARTGEMIDGWQFRAAWQDRLPAIAEPLSRSEAAAEHDAPSLRVARPMRANGRQGTAEAILRRTGTSRS